VNLKEEETSMRLSEVKVGDRLIVDAYFTCMRNKQIGIVFLTEEGKLAIPCDSGYHLLDGQADESGELIGLIRAPAYDK